MSKLTGRGHPMRNGCTESMLITSPDLGHRLWIDYETREQAEAAQAWLAAQEAVSPLAADLEMWPGYSPRGYDWPPTSGVASPQAPSYELHGYLVYETKFGGHWDFHPKDELPAGEFLKHREHTPVYVRNAGVLACPTPDHRWAIQRCANGKCDTAPTDGVAPMRPESWQCQRCGEPIGWLGRFMRGFFGRRLYARLIGCRKIPCGVQGKTV